MKQQHSIKKKKYLGYLREHKIIQDDEEIPTLLYPNKESFGKNIRDQRTNPKGWALRITLFFALGFCLFWSIIFMPSDKHVNPIYTSIIFISFAVLCITHYLLKLQKENPTPPPTQEYATLDYIVEFPIRLVNHSNPMQNICIVEGIICWILAMFLPLSFSDKADELILNSLEFILLFVLNYIAMYITLYKYDLYQENSHHFITSKRIYVNKNMMKNPYKSINISDLHKVEIVKETRRGGKGTTNTCYFLEYITYDKQKTAVQISLASLYASHKTPQDPIIIITKLLKKAFPNKEITFVDRDLT